LVESLWYLSRAFPYDGEWQRYGVDIANSLRFARVVRNLRIFSLILKNCGYAAIKNIYYNNFMNRMDSFFLAETLKYLYLIFDDDNWVHKGNYIFNTEAHILYVF
jgi:mannosidase alpha-like ER degradation enhancer 1